MFKKLLAEFIGTAVLVILGCGTAMMVGCDAVYGCGYILTALAFGLAIVAMAYSIGNISGCHVNPAVSLAMLIRGDLSVAEFFGYFGAQLLGATAGAAVLGGVFSLANISDITGNLGANGLASVHGSFAAGLLVEVILTFIFVLCILGVTSEAYDHGNVAGLVIGLALVVVHILGIGFTGTSVNPARSFGPALISLFAKNSVPIKELWVFIVGPLAGGALAGLCHKLLED